MNEERIREVFSDELFVKQLFEQEEPEAVQALLAEKEIDLSVEEIVKFQELLEKHMNGKLNLDELSDEDLEDVAGGALAEMILLISCLAGVAAVAAGGSLAGGAALTHHFTRRRW